MSTVTGRTVACRICGKPKTTEVTGNIVIEVPHQCRIEIKEHK